MCKFSTLKGHFFDSSMSFGEPLKVLKTPLQGPFLDERKTPFDAASL